MQPSSRSDLGETHGALIPSFIFASAPLLSIRTAPLRKHGTEEQTPRAAMRSSDRASRRDRESTLRRRMRPLELQPAFESATPPASQGRRTEHNRAGGPRETATSR